MRGNDLHLLASMNRFLASGTINEERFVHCRSADVSLVVFFLKKSSLARYRSALDFSVADYLTSFEGNYFLTSLVYGVRLRVKFVGSFNASSSVVQSVASHFQSVSWSEREVWDMFGIYSSGNPDVRRILTDYGFVGHPLRKDFPLSGHLEVCYALGHQRVVVRSVSLSQEFRSLNFASPWLS